MLLHRAIMKAVSESESGTWRTGRATRASGAFSAHRPPRSLDSTLGLTAFSDDGDGGMPRSAAGRAASTGACGDADELRSAGNSLRGAKR